MAPSAPGPVQGAGDAPTSESHSTSSYLSATAPSNADPAGSLTRTQSKTQAQLRQPVQRSSSIQDILETGRRRSEILSASNSNSNSNSHTNIHGLNQHQANSPQPLRRNSTIKITPEQAEHLREHEEFLEWKRQKAQRGAQRERDEGMDSADERSAIRSQGDGSDYGTSRNDSQPRTGDLRSRPSQRSQQSKKTVETARDEDDARENANQTGQIHSHTPPQRDGFWKRTFKQFGSLELENKGSVARDHLALERTFLAWLRTSLAFASIGIAVTQLFRLNTTLARDDPANHDGDPKTGAHLHLRALGKPIGATFIGISIVVLFTGYHRYFESQHWIIKGKFPASRGSIALISLIALLLMVASLVLILVVEPRTFEK